MVKSPPTVAEPELVRLFAEVLPVVVNVPEFTTPFTAVNLPPIFVVPLLSIEFRVASLSIVNVPFLTSTIPLPVRVPIA